MTLENFFKYLEDQEGVFDKIVRLRYKYSWEKEWTYSNELLLVDFNTRQRLPYIWCNDWNEGQEEVEVLGYIDIDEVEVPGF